jgi:hypothetical protein
LIEQGTFHEHASSSITGLYASMKAVKHTINSNKYDDGKARETIY